jgi:hypothetical protein
LNIKLSVKQRADTVGTLRFVSVFLMETLARWIPTTPEMEVKMLFSRQVWRMAQQADRLGRRARELRAPLHYSRAPRPEFLGALKQLADLGDTVDRIDAFHGVAMPVLAAAYSRYLAVTDRLTDEPTVIICDQALREIEAIRRDRTEWGSEIPPARVQESDALKRVRKAFADAKEMVDESEQPALAGA